MHPAWGRQLGGKNFGQILNSFVLLSSGHHNKIPSTGPFKQQKLYFSQFRRLEVPDQSASRVGLHEASSAACGQPTTRCAHMTSTVHWGTASSPYLLQGTNPVMRASPSGPHQTMIPSHRSHLQTASFWGLGLQHLDFGRHKYSVHKIFPAGLILGLVRVDKF